MLLKTVLVALGALSGIASSLPGRGSHGGGSTSYETFEQNLIFTPPTNYTDPRVLYPRTVQLNDGRILATWENYSPEPPIVWFPIYESLDGGLTWEEVGRVTDQVNGWGLRYQPFLYELDRDFGGFKKGTILCAGNSIPTDLSQTKIDLYASTDKGRSWEFVSSIAEGGVAIPVNEETPIWEPFILLYKDTMIIYYADQRPADHGQILSHQESTDLINWSEPIVDVAEPTYTDRPGMPFVVQLPTGEYMYTYEWGGSTVLDYYSFPLYYRVSADPRKFYEAEPHVIRAPDGSGSYIYPISSPNVVWSPVGGKDGTLIVSGSSKEVLINTELGADDKWVAVDVPEDPAYTRNLRILEDRRGRLTDYLMIMGAGHLPPSETNKVTVSVVKVSDLLNE